jgi:outer membrane protein OmpA-like peptidoglycan-associated protein
MMRFLVLLLVAAPVAWGQVRFDAGFGLVFPSASVMFQSLPGFPSCCPEFSGGSGTGFSAGLGTDVPILGSLFVTVRAGTADHGHTLTTRERVTVLVDGNETSADITHSMAISQRVYVADAALGYRLGRVALRAGVGYMLRGESTLTAAEQLEGPPGAAFLDTQSPTRNEQSGPLPEPVATSAQFVMSVAMSFPLDPEHRWMLSPEIGVAFPFGSITSMESWTVTVPAASIRVSWSPFGTSSRSQPDEATTEPKAVTPVENTPAPNTSTVTLDILGNPTITIDEVEQETYLAVLPYVFFDTDRDVVPIRYMRSLREPLPTSAEPPDRFHQRLLPLIAKRMREYPEATITVVGTISAREQNHALAGSRARTIASVLRDSFDIDARRITIQERTLPENPTRALGDEVQMADEENSRVEIHTSDHRVLLPYHVRDTVVEMTPPQLQIMARTPASGGLTGWTLFVNDTELRSSDQAFMRPVTYAPTPAMVRALLAAGEIRIRVDGDVDDHTVEDEAALPIEAKRLFSKRTVMKNDSIVEEFGLVIFPYNSAELTPMHLRVLDIVRAKIGTRARLDIEGRTDILGADDANLELSRQRAQAVADQLGSTATVTGRGEPAPSAPQMLPEQRMLERMVRIRALVPTSP